MGKPRYPWVAVAVMVVGLMVFVCGLVLVLLGKVFSAAPRPEGQTVGVAVEVVGLALAVLGVFIVLTGAVLFGIEGRASGYFAMADERVKRTRAAALAAWHHDKPRDDGEGGEGEKSGAA